MANAIINGGFPFGAMYAPFCRTLPPREEEWENDLKLMKELGFTCFHGFAEWHDIEQKKGIFNFSKVDRIIEIADKVGLIPLINVATQNGVGFYSPRWLMQEYKGDGFIDHEGNYDRHDNLYRIPCLDDPWYQEYAVGYLAKIAEHYAGNSIIGGWVIWGEPVLNRAGKPICYCNHTKARFVEWIRNKYRNIENLNEIWKTEGPSDFNIWEEINPPTGAGRQMGSYAAWHDWRSFMEDNLAFHVKNADRIFKENGAYQPTIVEMMSMMGSASGGSIDVWKLSETADIVGVSNFNRPGLATSYIASRADSIAKSLHKKFFVVEALGGPRYNTTPYHTPSDKELILEAVQMVSKGAKGFMYWCFRPRMSDTEGGEFGMIQSNGKVLPRAVETGDFSKLLQTKHKVLNNAKRMADVAIFDSQEIQHISSADNVSDRYNFALAGAYKILNNCCIETDFINTKNIIDGKLNGYQVLIMPFSYVIDEDVISCIKDFVNNGGTIIADYGLGLKNSKGFCFYNLPGEGLAEIFGIVKTDVRYIEEADLAQEDITICKETFVDIIQMNEAVEWLPFKDMKGISFNKPGKGKAIYIPFEFFYTYFCNSTSNYREIFIKLLKDAKVNILYSIGEVNEIDSENIEISTLLLENNERLVTIINHNSSPCKFKLFINTVPVLISEFFTDEGLNFNRISDGCEMQMSLQPMGYIMLRIKL